MRSVHSTFYDGYTPVSNWATINQFLAITSSSNRPVSHSCVKSGYVVVNLKISTSSVMYNVSLTPAVMIQP